ncbi:hypothetical protein GEMRC1_001755 [Eukaryota sp. GEM-RC1]
MSHVFYQFIDSSKLNNRQCFEPLEGLSSDQCLTLYCCFNTHNRKWKSQVASTKTTLLNGLFTFNYQASVYPPGDYLHLRLSIPRKKQPLSKNKDDIIASHSISLVQTVQHSFSGTVTLLNSSSQSIAKVLLTVESVPLVSSTELPVSQSLLDQRDSETESEKETEQFSSPVLEVNRTMLKRNQYSISGSPLGFT